jgi:hypothetical protein
MGFQEYIALTILVSCILSMCLSSLPRTLLYCLDQIFRFCFLWFDFSILDPLLLIVTLQIVSLHNTHSDLLILCVCLFFCLHICMLYFYCLVPFISVLVLSLTGTASVGAAHFTCRMNPVVCFRGGGVCQ